MEPDERKKKILSAIVQNYIDTGEPVGSKTLIAEAGLKVSSATVRNDMAYLTEQGYIAQPHTSAGRVPTQLGYRYFVDNAMRVKPISSQGREYISETLAQNADSPESILRGAANLLAKLTDRVAVTTTPNGDESRIRKISFVQTGARTAMTVLIASNGMIKTKLFRCEFLLTPEILNMFEKAFNDTFAGIRLSSVNQPFIQTAAAGFGELSLFMPSALLSVKEACAAAREVSICHSGYIRLMLAAEAGAAVSARLLEFLYNERELAATLERLPMNTSVKLGQENRRVELASSAVISARYSVDSNPSGVLAVIGPLRTDYARVISILNCVSECVSQLIKELIEI